MIMSNGGTARCLPSLMILGKGGGRAPPVCEVPRSYAQSQCTWPWWPPYGS